MGAERDSAGQAGSDLTGTGGGFGTGFGAGTGASTGMGSGVTGGVTRDTAGMEAGTSGSAATGDRGLGGAEVHTGLHAGGSAAGTGYGSLAFAEGNEQSGTGERVKEKARDVAGQVRGAAETLADRAGELPGQARDAMNRAHTALEDRGVLDHVRNNSLPALGIAFGVGFLLAGRDNTIGKPGTKVYDARQQLRTAVVGGLSAAVAQQAQLMMGGSQANKASGFFDSLLGKVFGGGIPHQQTGGSGYQSSGSGNYGGGSQGSGSGYGGSGYQGGGSQGAAGGYGTSGNQGGSQGSGNYGTSGYQGGGSGQQGSQGNRGQY